MSPAPRRSRFRDTAALPALPLGKRLVGRAMDLLLGRRAPPTAPPAAPLVIAAADDPRAFQPSVEGSSIFGRWTLDEAGLPAYLYELDQHKDPRASYPHSEGLDRRDHWHLVGNDRLNALASNDGTVQLYLNDRGGVFLNRFEADDEDVGCLGFLRVLLRLILGWFNQRRVQRALRARAQTAAPRGVPKEDAAAQAVQAQTLAGAAPSLRHTYAGGFAYLDDGEAVWASAYRYRPPGAQTRRLFGLGYFETEMTHRDIRLTRRVYAPDGDDPALLSDVRLENRGAAAVNLRYYEYWDVNVHQLQVGWLRTGALATLNDDERRAANAHFTPSVAWDETHRALRCHQQLKPGVTLPGPPCALDSAPADVFLADLSGSPAARYTDKVAFFGDGGARQPDAVRLRREGDPADRLQDEPMPFCLVLRRDLHLEPGASAELRFACGAARPEATLAFLEKYRTGDALAATLDTWKRRLACFTTGESAVLQREMAWHAYCLQASSVYQEFYDAHVIPQGSAYLYLHGADGAPRDTALFVLPLVYLRPDLARETLRLLMRLQYADGLALPYAFTGHGLHSDAYVHRHPSDLDLFLLLALLEYLAATGDRAFLSEPIPFYPPDAPPPASVPGTTTLDHARAAFLHLKDSVGIGQHGLVRISDGDWSDSIVLETTIKAPLKVSYEQTVAHGESIPNSQMALYVLPHLAAILQAHDPALAGAMRDFAAPLRQALKAQWRGQWYRRAILRDMQGAPLFIDDENINLEAQVWALISGLAAEDGHEAALVEAIRVRLDDPSPIGATLIEKGMVWPAVSQLLTWGYARCYPDLAWRSLHRHAFAAHAEVFPNVWINVWTGPDGVNGADQPNPGGTWVSPVTPMTDFPAMNANQHAMALLGLLRVCGVEPSPSGDGLTLAPQDPPGRFTLDLPLLRLHVAPGRIAGKYRAHNTGSLTLRVRLPAEATGFAARVGGQALDPAPSEGQEVLLPLAFREGDVIPFEVTWRGG